MERYTYISTVSSGAYGVVYQCRDTETGQLVAAKGIKAAHEDATVMRLTVREVKVLKQLPPHANIVRLLEAFRSKSGRVYLVFEYVERSLYQEMDRHPGGFLPGPMLKSVAWQLLHALAHCHDHKIMHRDVKPANVLLTGYTPGVGSGGVAKLCDFGFARLVRSAAAAGGAGRGVAGGGGGGRSTADAPSLYNVMDEKARLSSYVMTRWYRPPEVLVGEPYGTPIDVWSFGCTVAELATGRPLFPGSSTLDQVWRIMRCLGPLPPAHMARIMLDRGLQALAPPPPRSRCLRQRLPELPPDLLDLISACLTLDPRRRPTVHQLLQMPYFHDMPRLLAGTDLATQLPYAAAGLAAAAADEASAGDTAMVFNAAAPSPPRSLQQQLQLLQQRRAAAECVDATALAASQPAAASPEPRKARFPLAVSTPDAVTPSLPGQEQSLTEAAPSLCNAYAASIPLTTANAMAAGVATTPVAPATGCHRRPCPAEVTPMSVIALGAAATAAVAAAAVPSALSQPNADAATVAHRTAQQQAVCRRGSGLRLDVPPPSMAPQLSTPMLAAAGPLQRQRVSAVTGGDGAAAAVVVVGGGGGGRRSASFSAGSGSLGGGGSLGGSGESADGTGGSKEPAAPLSLAELVDQAAGSRGGGGGAGGAGGSALSGSANVAIDAARAPGADAAAAAAGSAALDGSTFTLLPPPVTEARALGAHSPFTVNAAAAAAEAGVAAAPVLPGTATAVTALPAAVTAADADTVAAAAPAFSKVRAAVPLCARPLRSCPEPATCVELQERSKAGAYATSISDVAEATDARKGAAAVAGLTSLQPAKDGPHGGSICRHEGLIVPEGPEALHGAGDRGGAVAAAAAAAMVSSSPFTEAAVGPCEHTAESPAQAAYPPFGGSGPVGGMPGGGINACILDRTRTGSIAMAAAAQPAAAHGTMPPASPLPAVSIARSSLGQVHALVGRVRSYILSGGEGRNRRARGSCAGVGGVGGGLSGGTGIGGSGGGGGLHLFPGPAPRPSYRHRASDASAAIGVPAASPAWQTSPCAMSYIQNSPAGLSYTLASPPLSPLDTGVERIRPPPPAPPLHRLPPGVAPPPATLLVTAPSTGALSIGGSPWLLSSCGTPAAPSPLPCAASPMRSSPSSLPGLPSPLAGSPLRNPRDLGTTASPGGGTIGRLSRFGTQTSSLFGDCGRRSTGAVSTVECDAADGGDGGEGVVEGGGGRGGGAGGGAGGLYRNTSRWMQRHGSEGDACPLAQAMRGGTAPPGALTTALSTGGADTELGRGPVSGGHGAVPGSMLTHALRQQQQQQQQQEQLEQSLDPASSFPTHGGVVAHSPGCQFRPAATADGLIGESPRRLGAPASLRLVSSPMLSLSMPGSLHVAGATGAVGAEAGGGGSGTEGGDASSTSPTPRVAGERASAFANGASPAAAATSVGSYTRSRLSQGSHPHVAHATAPTAIPPDLAFASGSPLGHNSAFLQAPRAPPSMLRRASTGNDVTLATLPPPLAAASAFAAATTPTAMRAAAAAAANSPGRGEPAYGATAAHSWSVPVAPPQRRTTHGSVTTAPIAEIDTEDEASSHHVRIPRDRDPDAAPWDPVQPLVLDGARPSGGDASSGPAGRQGAGAALPRTASGVLGGGSGCLHGDARKDGRAAVGVIGSNGEARAGKLASLKRAVRKRVVSLKARLRDLMGGP